VAMAELMAVVLVVAILVWEINHGNY
jgi:Tfp pilus assembly protein PilE